MHLQSLQELLQSILDACDDATNSSLVPAVRKALRLASLAEEPEWHMYFELHLKGIDLKDPLSSPIFPTTVEKLKWTPAEKVRTDRTDDSGDVLSQPLDQLVDSLKQVERSLHGINPKDFSSQEIEFYRARQANLTAIGNIRNRLTSFATEMEGKLLIRPESQESSLPSKSKNGQRRVFIGHGRSHVWKELRDFLEDRLMLSTEEFEKSSSPGMSIKERLEEMLENVSFAFLVMTAEDEHADGSAHARENVIHEVGLFQGRLGFMRAIILLEDGCKEFSNIHGLVQIRFPKEDIEARFEKIRDVLKREGLIE